jgi:outer membrane protein assembly factor BamB
VTGILGPGGRLQLRPRRRICLLVVGALVGLAGVVAPAGQAGADASSSSGYQVDAGHTGRLWGAGVIPPLTHPWSDTLGGAAFDPSYAVISGAYVYVVNQSNEQLQAIALSSGTVVWRASLNVDGGADGPYIAVDSGKVFVVGDDIYPAGSDQDGEVVDAYDTVSGRLLWTARPLGTSPVEPIVSGGTLYVETTDDAGNRAAIRETDGTVLWDVNNHSVPVGDYDGGPVTLAGSHLVGYDTCANGVGSNPLTGQINWIASGDCSVASGMLGVSAGSYVWFGDIDAGQNWDQGSGAGNVAVNPATGIVAGSFPAGTSPVFADGVGFQRREVILSQSNFGTVLGGNLAAFNPTTGATLWTFTGTGGSHNVASMPLAADGYIFAASTGGNVWALNPTNGAVVYTFAPTAKNTVYPDTGIAAGSGYLVVVAHGRLIALKGSAAPSGPAPAAWTKAPGAPSVTASQAHERSR